MWVLIIALGVAGVYLVLNKQILIGIIALVVFIFFMQDALKQKPEKVAIPREQLIRIAAAKLADFYKVSILQEGVPDIKEDKEVGDNHRFIFRIPGPHGTLENIPVTINRFTAELGEMTGARIGSGEERAEYFARQGTGREQQNQKGIPPEQLNEIKRAARGVFDEELDAQRLRESADNE